MALHEPSAEHELRELFLHLRCPASQRPPKMREDMDGREIVVTPFDGAYGNAGVVIALNGSPPRGVIVVLENRNKHNYHRNYAPIFYLTESSSRRLGARQVDIVRAFLAEKQDEC